MVSFPSPWHRSLSSSRPFSLFSSYLFFYFFIHMTFSFPRHVFFFLSLLSSITIKINLPYSISFYYILPLYHMFFFYSLYSISQSSIFLFSHTILPYFSLLFYSIFLFPFSLSSHLLPFPLFYSLLLSSILSYLSFYHLLFPSFPFFSHYILFLPSFLSFPFSPLTLLFSSFLISFLSSFPPSFLTLFPYFLSSSIFSHLILFTLCAYSRLAAMENKLDRILKHLGI